MLWIIDPAVPAGAVARARAAGIPVVTLERPQFTVDASVVYPNFNHGVYMSEYLATLLPPGARVAVVGGPDVVDDIELMLGLLHGLDIAGLTRVNDPEDPRYKNTTDVASGGQEKTANILADFGHLDGLIPFNDETLLGAVEALREAGRLGEVKMVSRNGTPAAVDLIRDGIHHGTWDIDGPGIGAAAAGLVLRALAGRGPRRAVRRQPHRADDHRGAGQGVGPVGPADRAPPAARRPGRRRRRRRQHAGSSTGPSTGPARRAEP